MSSSALSERARRFTGERPPLAVAAMRCLSNPYDAKTNPTGYLNMGLAENGLMWDMLEPKVRGPRDATLDLTRYNDLNGILRFRTALASFFKEHFGVAQCQPGEITVACGSSSIVHMLFNTICDKGDCVIIPAPYYGGFDHDLTAFANCVVEEAVTKEEDNWAPTEASLEAALVSAVAKKLKPKALLLTTPGNPHGAVLSLQEMQMCADFCDRHGLHLVYDCLFAKSIIGSASFVSPYACNLSEHMRTRMHVVWGFAKDFGMGGYHVGVMHSRNQLVNSVVAGMSMFSVVSTDTQLLLAPILEDAGWTARYFAAYQTRLTAIYEKLAALLDKNGLKYTRPQGGIFVWVDLRKYLSEPTFAAEMALFERLFEEGRVYLSAGRFFHGTEPGWFRFCYTNSSDVALLEVAVQRVMEVLKKKRVIGECALKAVDSIFDHLKAQPSQVSAPSGESLFQTSLSLVDALIAHAKKSQEEQALKAEIKLGDAALKKLDDIFAVLKAQPLSVQAPTAHTTACAPFDASITAVSAMLATVGKVSGKPAADTAAKKEKKHVQSKPAASAKDEKPDIHHVNIVVGEVVDAKKHPDADSLYVETVNLGDKIGTAVTVVSGLARFVPLEELRGKRALFVTNLKPAKMRGILSSAMILAASNDDHSKVELVLPDQSTPIGERVVVQGFEGEADDVLNPKKKIWEEVQPLFSTTTELVAAWNGVPLATSKGVCKVASLANAHIA